MESKQDDTQLKDWLHKCGFVVKTNGVGYQTIYLNDVMVNAIAEYVHDEYVPKAAQLQLVTELLAKKRKYSAPIEYGVPVSVLQQYMEKL